MVKTPGNSGQRIVLDVCGVRKSFGRHPVLDEVTFRMKEGEIAGIVGENGSGKSTLLKIVVGLLAPSSGTARATERIGYCPQDLLIFETLTVAENFSYFARAYGLIGKDRASGWHETKRDLLGRFRFQAFDGELVSTLSGGTKQKLNFCLSVLHSPGLLILDEPYSGFDWETYLHFWDYAGALREKGRCILIVSHFIYDRSQFDALYELKEGVLRCA